MSENEYHENLDAGFPSHLVPRESERDRLDIELREKLIRLNEQARIFIPLIALGLIVAIPVWSKSPTRFLELLLSPFVFLPLGFCILHLARAGLGIVRVKSRIRALERTAERGRGV